jgi:hypothetical protein
MGRLATRLSRLGRADCGAREGRFGERHLCRCLAGCSSLGDAKRKSQPTANNGGVGRWTRTNQGQARGSSEPSLTLDANGPGGTLASHELLVCFNQARNGFAAPQMNDCVPIVWWRWGRSRRSGTDNNRITIGLTSLSRARRISRLAGGFVSIQGGTPPPERISLTPRHFDALQERDSWYSWFSI